MADRARACAEWESALPLHALGALEGEEARTVADHVQHCPACAQRVRDFEAAADSLAFAVPAATAAPSVRTELLRGAAQPQLSRRPASVWLRPVRVPAWAVAVAAALLVALPTASAAVMLNERAAVQRQGERLAALERKAAAGIPGVPDRSQAARVVSLSGSAAAPTAAGELAWYPSIGQVALAIHRLPPASAGRGYQAWLRRDKDWISLGMLVTNGAGEGLLLVPLPATLAAYDAFWLSEEPIGGSAQPNGPKLIVARFA
jgi:anti-sigma factor RsiW